MLIRPSFRPAFALALVALGTSCSDATAPRLHPMSGVYAFTTALDSLSYEDSGPLGCGSINIMYCVRWKADSRGHLTGTFEVDDDVSPDSGPGGLVYDQVDGQAEGTFGDQAVSVLAPSGSLSGPVDASDTTRSVVVVLTGSAREGIRLAGTVAGDSIVGTVYWSQTVARNPPTYKGTFVARRVR
jgi:hypothetical protein